MNQEILTLIELKYGVLTWTPESLNRLPRDLVLNFYNTRNRKSSSWHKYTFNPEIESNFEIIYHIWLAYDLNETQILERLENLLYYYESKQ